MARQALLHSGWWFYLRNLSNRLWLTQWQTADITIQPPIAKSTREATQCLIPSSQFSSYRQPSSRRQLSSSLQPSSCYSRIKVWQFRVIKRFIVHPRYATMPYIKMAIRWIYAQNDAVAKCIRAAFKLWLSMVRMPSSTRAPISIFSVQCLTTVSTPTSLSVPNSCSNNRWKWHSNIPPFFKICDITSLECVK